MSKTLDSRRQSRELALQILFQKEFSQFESTQQLIEIFSQSIDPSNYVTFAEKIVSRIDANKEAIDETILKYLNNWKLERLAKVDLILLRIAVCEMKFLNDDPTPPKVALNEALEIAKKFSSQESSQFLNGVLDKVLTNEL